MMLRGARTRGAHFSVPLLRYKSSSVGGSARKLSTSESEVQLLEQLLEAAKTRKLAPASSGDSYDGPAFNIKTFNAISPAGLKAFPEGKYKYSGDDSALGDHMAVMLRSHKVKKEEISETVRVIARCGAGTNNIPVDEMTEMGIPVLNTPGANANAVKELVVCALLMASRGIAEGVAHTNELATSSGMSQAEISAQVEKDKKLFVGTEVSGKTLGVIGLGNIGASVVKAALGLGMKVIGYDPSLSVEAAWNVPGDRMQRAKDVRELVSKSDYVTLHVPYIKGATHHMMNFDMLNSMKPGAHLINFSRGELVDTSALASLYEANEFSGKYVSDFVDLQLHGNPKVIPMPHLGASTAEAEENSARMAAEQIKDFLEYGTIRNSVNFPSCSLAPLENTAESGRVARMCIVNRNVPGVLGAISTYLGDQGVNIQQQLNTSRNDIAYTVVDCVTVKEGEEAEKWLESVQDGLGAINGVVSSRFLGQAFRDGDKMGAPGSFFKVYH